jgi:hypothetical protein
MRLETGFLAQAAEVVSDGRVFVHGGGIEGFAVPDVPVLIPSVAIVLRFHFLLNECGAEHNVRVTVTDPNDADCGLAGAIVLNPQPPLDFPERGVKLFAVLAITNLMFPLVGVYAVNLFVNERRLDGFTVGIVRARPPIDEAR